MELGLTPKEPWYERYDIGMIPKAIERANQVQPDPSIQLQWEGAIYRNLEEPDPKFSWWNFLRSCLP